ncbi:MAG: VanZ family protein [Firmicutes bacterium]|nr:VanZ family protein [Bacillota bacterium]
MSTGRKILRTILITLTVIWVLFIFYNSIANGSESAQLSGSILRKINELIESSGISISEHLLRKTAHFVEFSILGILLMTSTLVSVKGALGNNIFIPLFCGLLTAVSDETIQLFSDGRSGQVSDVMLDFGGVLFGIGCIYVIRCVIKMKGK